MVEFVAVIRPELIELTDELHELVIIDVFQKGPGRRDDWIRHVAGIEVTVPKRPTEKELRAAVETRVAAFEMAANSGPTPGDTRARRPLRSPLVGRDIGRGGA